ncbi:MAG: MFS transporter [Verrucomicrobiales bacterium]|nr:MFS transporter [Verrucomicrobiales bacterium]
MKKTPVHPQPPPENDIASESLLQQIRAMPRPVWVLFAGVFINRFGTFVVPFLTLYLTDEGYTAWEISAVIASMAVGGILSTGVSGRLSDLIGRKNTMSIALITGGISMLLMWQAESFSGYLITAFLAGATHQMYHPAASSLMADVVPSARRVTAYAIVRWGINLGWACGMAAGGFLAEKNYAYLFIGDAATSISYALIAMFLLPQGVRTTVKKSRWAPAIRHMIRNRAFVAFFFANLLAVSTFFQWSISVARLVTDLGYEKWVYALIMSANGLLIAIFEIPISQLCRHLNPRRVIAFGYLFCGIGASMCGLASGWLIVFFAMVVFTLGEMVSMPVSGAYIADLAPEKMRGRYNAMTGFTWGVGHGIAPLGLVLYEKNDTLLWLAMLLVGFGSAACLIGPWSQRIR